MKWWYFYILGCCPRCKRKDRLVVLDTQKHHFVSTTNFWSAVKENQPVYFCERCKWVSRFIDDEKIEVIK